MVLESYEEKPFLEASQLDIDELRTDARNFDFTKRDINAETIGLVPTAVGRARAVLQYAQSYRGFWVASTAVVYDTNPEQPRIALYSSANFKAKISEDERTPEDVDNIPKVCAEMDIILRAGLDGFQRIGLFVVTATTNPKRIKEVTGVESKTLHPCSECGTAMKKDKLVDKNTILLSVGSGQDIAQVQTFKEYKTRYRFYEKYGLFEDAEAQRYSPHDYPDKQTAYGAAVRKGRVGGTVYDLDQRRERKRQELAVAALKAA